MLLVSGATATVAQYPEVGRLIVPGAGNTPEIVRGRPWAMDNGAFSGLDVPLFLRMLRRFQAQRGCLFVTVPDVVGDHAATLECFRDWAPTIAQRGWPVAFVGQNRLRMTEVPWASCAAIFLGGSPECLACDYVCPSAERRHQCPHCGRALTEWKLSAMARDLAAYAKARGKWVHMGRVNSSRRIRTAIRFGCDSIDGTSFSRWSNVHIPRGVRAIERFNGGPLLQEIA